VSERVLLADPDLREGFVTTLGDRLPAGWTASDDPAGATAVVTENVDVDVAALNAQGASVRLVAKLDTGSATIRPGAARLLEVPNTALTGVAELTVTFILALFKDLRRVHDATRARAWLPDRAEPILTDQRRYTYNWIGIEDFGTLYRKRIGLVGLGHIGRAVAARLRPFGVRLLYTQRTRLDPAEEERLGVRWRAFDELLAEADLISLHHRFHDAPEAEGGNDRQFDADAFARMRRGVRFVNTARGRLVDEQALADALASGHVASAALDVFRHEPLPDDHPFFAVSPERLLMTPHIAGAPIDEAWRLAADEIIEALGGASPDS
jgi:phosphoglycerate dehydrogenase-like enzyme